MSRGSTNSFPPSSFALFAVASTSATWKYGIQFGGTFAFGPYALESIMPAPGVPLTLNSVYAFGPSPPVFALQPKSCV